MNFVRTVLIATVCALPSGSPAIADQIDKSRVPPIETYKLMLDGNRQNGWVQFRNYDGRQWIYFTAMQTLHCRLKEIRYSINSDALDQRVEVAKCNKALPFSVSDDAINGGLIYKSMPLGTAQWVAVQVVWEDDSESEVQKVKVCEDVGESTCGIVE